jgi:hypothetical protein
MNRSHPSKPATGLRIAARLVMLIALWGSVSAPILAQQQAEAPPIEEPTEAEIEAAYATMLADINRRSREIFDAAEAALLELTLEDLKKLKCHGLDRVGIQYDCRVELRMRQAQRRPKTALVNLWLTYEDNGWVAR